MSTHFASSVTELEDAIQAANEGDTIYLAPGVYDGITIEAAHFSSAITIRSLDPENRAILTGKTDVSSCSGINFEELRFKLENPPDNNVNSGYNALIYIEKSSEIAVIDSKIEGLIPNYSKGDPIAERSSAIIEGFGTGFGIQINQSSSVTIEGNELSDLYTAIGINGAHDTLIERNNFHDIRTDCVQGTDHVDTVIRENLFANSRPWHVDPENPDGATDDHSDFIQFWGTGAQFGVRNFSIQNNVFLQESGVTQTIFGTMNLLGNEQGNVALENFEISGNLIYNASGHGISISGVDGARIFNNTLLPNSEVLSDYKSVPGIYIAYKGPYAHQSDFDLYASYTTDETASKNIQISHNLVSNSYGEKIRIKAFSDNNDNYEEVVEHLKLSIYLNQFLDSPKTSLFEYSDYFDFELYSSDDIVNIELNPSKLIYNSRTGSKYYYDKVALESFFSNLNLDRSYVVSGGVNSDIDDLPLLQLEDQIPLNLWNDSESGHAGLEEARPFISEHESRFTSIESSGGEMVSEILNLTWLI